MVMSYSKRGLIDWMVQRVTAVYLIVYFIPLLFMLFSHGPDSYFVWKGIFQLAWVKVATVVAVISIALHAWVGLWTVFTDYVKCCKIRMILQSLVVIVLVGYVVWACVAVWSI